jgi:hypothetical protein
MEIICFNNSAGQYGGECWSEFVAGTSATEKSEVVMYKKGLIVAVVAMILLAGCNTKKPVRFINGTDKGLNLDQQIVLLEGQFLLASDVWWRSGFTEPQPKETIKGKVVGWMKSL